MNGKLVFEVTELPVTPEERERYHWGEGVEHVFWLVYYTLVEIPAEGVVIRQPTAMQRVAWFNYDSDARLFQSYLTALQN